LRATLLTVGALGLLLALGAVLRSPVRRHAAARDRGRLTLRKKKSGHAMRGR
jgi:hypothetical protein